MVLLQQILRGQTHTSYAIVQSPVLSETQEESLDHKTNEVSITPSSLDVVDRRLTPYRGILSPNISCKCVCHQLRVFCSPQVLTKSFGRVIVGVSGHVFSEPTCNESTCHDKSRYSMIITYFFPSWWIAKAIILTCVRNPYGNPTMGLYVRNLLPEHSPMIRAITSGSVTNLQSIFQNHISTPNDMEEMGWTGLTVGDILQL